MSQFTEYFLGSNTKVVELETLEISHPNMTQTFWIVRNARAGITATLETGLQQFFTYYPVRISDIGQREDLDQGYNITIGDVGETLPNELDAILAAEGMSVKPTIKFRSWRSDYLTVPLYGPVVLEMKKITTARSGSMFQARAPQLNSTKTGELYRLDRFKMLRGLL